MATTQVTLTVVRDDGSSLDATVEANGTDSQMSRLTDEFIARLRGPGPAKARPANTCTAIVRRAAVGQ